MGDRTAFMMFIPHTQSSIDVMCRLEGVVTYTNHGCGLITGLHKSSAPGDWRADIMLKVPTGVKVVVLTEDEETAEYGWEES